MIKQDEVRSALADVRSGLAYFERVLDTVDTGNGPISRGHIDLVGALMIRGSVDVWYRGEYIPITTDVLLAGRDEDQIAVLRWLREQPQLLSLQADDPEEAMAFLSKPSSCINMDSFLQQRHTCLCVSTAR
ncbi:hypothetical protein [Burkholderia contaminans]|uniref:hypothetical protein n=1 Tax=Burkholderia contaminans TaxID=488447 RepID=UPI0021AB1BF3|nr:hypothetical protein [Burkholderia contaminans]